MDATRAVDMEIDTVAPEDTAVGGGELDVFVGDAKLFINGVSGGLMDVTCVK